MAFIGLGIIIIILILVNIDHNIVVGFNSLEEILKHKN